MPTMSILIIPEYVQCYECGRPADKIRKDESKSNDDPGVPTEEEYVCYIYKCVECGTETLRCFKNEPYPPWR